MNTHFNRDREGLPRGNPAGFPKRSAPRTENLDEQTISLSITDMVPDIVIPGYSIIRELKKGGQAVIYLAIQESTGRKVAIKLIYQAKVSEEERERMEREVRVLAELDHSSIVSIIDRGSTQESWPYFVMEYIQGKTLQQWIDDYQQRHAPVGIPRDLTEVLRLFTRICDTINAAHLRGIVHRDLKPTNIIIDTYGDPHILDFGLAHGAAAWLTKSREETKSYDTYEFHGSLPWASPEQAEGDESKLDTRTDVYSLGIILFQMLTGEFPYEVFGKALDTLQNIREKHPMSPSTAIKRKMSETTQQRSLGLRRTMNPIDPKLDALVLKSLEKEPGKRYQTAGEFSKEMNQYLSGKPISASEESRQSKKAIIGLPAAIVIVAAIFGGLYFWKTTIHDVSQSQAQPPTQLEKPVEEPEDTESLTRLWGYRYNDAQNTIEFEFNPTYYEIGRYEDGILRDLPAIEEIQWINVAGAFNDWNATDSEWLMQKRSSHDYFLSKPIDLFEEKANWPYKFVINGKIWVGPPPEAGNKVRVQDDSETFNFVLYTHAEADTRLEVVRFYRRKIDKAWPGMSAYLTMDDDLKYTFSMYQIPHNVKISDLEPLRGIPLVKLLMGDVFVTDFEPLTAVNTLETLILGDWLYNYMFSETLKSLQRKDYVRARATTKETISAYLTIPAFMRFDDLMGHAFDGMEALEASPDNIPESAKSFQGRRYLYVPLQLNWQQARAYCERFGAHLATIGDEEELDWIVTNFTGMNLGKPIWLGGTDSGSEGNWRWVTGETWNYSNWTGEEPNNLYGNENALRMQWDGLWFDHNEINDVAPFIMEWDTE